MLPKIDEVRAVIHVKSPSIFCITETWLNSSVDSCLVYIHGYTVCRSDRFTHRGGGTAVYIRSEYNFAVVDNSAISPFNCDCCIIDVLSVKCLLICIYIPPNIRAGELQQIHDAIVDVTDKFLSSKPHYQQLILGDFNHFNVQSLCSDLGLRDIVTKPTRATSILDHVLISYDLTSVYDENRVEYDCPIGKSDHLMISCFPSIQTPLPDTCHYVTLFDLRWSNLMSLFGAASTIDWSAIVSEDKNVNAQWNAFYSCLESLIAENIPTHQILMKDSDKEWITPLVKHLINERWRAYRQRQWAKFNHLKNKVKIEIAKAKSLWADKMRKSSNGLWKIVNQIQGKRTHDPLSSLIVQHGSVKGLLNVLQSNLSRCFAKDSKRAVAQLDDDIDRNGVSWNMNICEHDVWKQLTHLKVSKSPGHDGIPNRIYKVLADVISHPLSIIFNNSVSKGVLPIAWKKGIVIPLPKTNPASIEKLRFITLLPTPLKILEKLVMRSVGNEIVLAYGKEQHGFRPHASTTTALLQLTDYALRRLNESSVFGIALASFDLSRAFDTVDCDLVVEKMEYLGFPKSLTK